MNRHSRRNVYMRVTLLIAMTLLLMTGTATLDASTAQLADVPVPANTEIQLVAQNMIHNGNRLSLATYSSALSIEESAAFYRQIWSNDNADNPIPGLVETRAGDWLLISRLGNGHNTVVQLSLSEPHKSTGFLSIMPVPGLGTDESLTDSVKSATAPDDFELLSSTRTQDSTRQSQLSVYSSSHSIGAATRQYIKHLQDQNWTLVSERSHAQSRVVLMNRKSMRIEIVVSIETRNGGSVIVVNETQDRG